MSQTSKIEWTDATWNPVRGCSRVSEGCRHCYAERIAARMSKPGQWGHGFAERTPSGSRWTGRVEIMPNALDWPLRWKGAPAARAEGRPSRIFVNSTSDLFHESLSDEAIAAVFGVMAAAPQHTFQVLTKRSERMRAWFAGWERAAASGHVSPPAECMAWAESVPLEGLTLPTNRGLGKNTPQYEVPAWPLPNVWLGVSVEDQQRADERIPLLLQTPAAVRGVSYEPALAAVDFERYVFGPTLCSRCGSAEAYYDPNPNRLPSRQSPLTGRPECLLGGPLTGEPGASICSKCGAEAEELPTLDWVIVGGESGPGARPFDVAWARSAVRQCREADVAVFVKQMGSNVREPSPDGDPGLLQWTFQDSKGGDIEEFPPDLRVREFPWTPRRCNG